MSNQKPLYHCQLRPHNSGKFQVNNQRFMPEWPRTNFPNDSDTDMRELVWLGIGTAQRNYSGRVDFPRKIDVRKYEDGRITIAVID